MKVIILTSEEPLQPFSEPAAALALGRTTVRDRLIKQLKTLKLEPQLLPEHSVTDWPETTLVLKDNLVLSDSFLENFLKNIPHKHLAYQCHVDHRHYPVMSPRQAGVTCIGESVLKPVTIFYTGQGSQIKPLPKQSLSINTDADFNQKITPLTIDPRIVFELKEGLPAQMNQKIFSICYLEHYALNIDYWFDYLTAANLFSREHAAKLMARAKKSFFIGYLKNFLRFQRMRHILIKATNHIGPNCRIHPSAQLEGCVIEPGVDIGPFVCARASYIGAGAVIRENSSINFSYIGQRAYIMGCKIFNAVVGTETSIFTPMLYNSVVGEKCFLSGGSGFADYNTGDSAVRATIEKRSVDTGLYFLGGCTGDHCFVGSGLIFGPGKMIPHHSKLINNHLIQKVPIKPGGIHVRHHDEWVQLPETFIS